MASVTTTGKIVPASVDTPDAATPPPANIPGGAIEAAAAKTAAGIAEASAAHSVMAGNMSGGGDVEVKVPGVKMPTNGDGPSFADTYTSAVGSLHQMKSDGAADSLTSAPAEVLAPQSAGGLAMEPAGSDNVYDRGGARIGRHWRTPQSRFHPGELAKGVKMEMEHTDSPRIALEIAKDHLSELPDYYTRLEKMEKRAFAERKKKAHTKKNGRRNKRTHRRSHR